MSHYILPKAAKLPVSYLLINVLCIYRKTIKPSKEPKKRRAPSTNNSSGSNREPKKKSSKAAAAPSSRTAAGPSNTFKRTCEDLFGDEDAEAISKAKSRSLPSVLWRRVAGGLLKRTEDLDGDLFVEVRVYKKADIEHLEPRERYWKATVNLRYQVDEGEPEVEQLFKFLKLAKAKFVHEGSFSVEQCKKED